MKWTLEYRNWGSGNCCGHRGRVASRGNWSVVGQTGRFKVIAPDGWECEKDFQFESEAMEWVENKTQDKAEVLPK